MDNNYEDRNKTQIIRIDARNCFVESKSDAFDIGKVHLEFATYDTSKPAGQRQTNNVHIYIDAPEFLCLAQEALNGMLHARAKQIKANDYAANADKKYKNTTVLYQSLGGTSAEKLRQTNRARADGKSLSRIVKLMNGDKTDDQYYLFIADSGAGEADSKGLIVPKFGSNPENHVAVSMNWRTVNEFMMMTKVHYEAWLAAKYMTGIVVSLTSANNQANPVQNNTPKQNQPQNPPPQNNGASNNIRNDTDVDDMRMF